MPRLSWFDILLAVAALGMVALAAAWRWSSRAPVDGAACGRCGHDVRWRTSSSCPECGADLPSVGIITPEMGRTSIIPRRATVLVVLVTLLAGVAGATAWRIATRTQPVDGVMMSISLSVDRPASGAFQSLVLDGRRTTRHGHIRFGPHCLRIVRNDGTRSRPLCITPVDRPVPGGGPLAGEPVITDTDLPLERVMDWGRSIGLDPSDASVRTELTDIHRVATGSIRDDDVVSGVPLQGFAGGIVVSTGLRPADRRAPVILGGAVGLGCLGIGLGAIVRWTRAERAARRAATGGPSP